MCTHDSGQLIVDCIFLSGLVLVKTQCNHFPVESSKNVVLRGHFTEYRYDLRGCCTIRSSHKLCGALQCDDHPSEKRQSIVVAVIYRRHLLSSVGLSDVEGNFPMLCISGYTLPTDRKIWLSNDSIPEHSKWLLLVLDYSSHQRDTLNADLLVLRVIVANKILLQGKYSDGGQKLRRSWFGASLSSSTSLDQHIWHQRATQIAYNVKYSFSKMHASKSSNDTDFCWYIVPRTVG
jgi:hypothetical protein